MSQEVVQGETIHLTSLFDALGDEHRLRILVSLYLADPGEEFWPEDLLRVGEHRDDVFPALYHVHFPKLDQLGLVEWNREENSVTRGPEFGAVDQLLDCLVVHDEEIQAGVLRFEV